MDVVVLHVSFYISRCFRKMFKLDEDASIDVIASEFVRVCVLGMIAATSTSIPVRPLRVKSCEEVLELECVFRTRSTDVLLQPLVSNPDQTYTRPLFLSLFPLKLIKWVKSRWWWWSAGRSFCAHYTQDRSYRLLLRGPLLPNQLHWRNLVFATCLFFRLSTLPPLPPPAWFPSALSPSHPCIFHCPLTLSSTSVYSSNQHQPIHHISITSFQFFLYNPCILSPSLSIILFWPDGEFLTSIFSLSFNWYTYCKTFIGFFLSETRGFSTWVS